MGDNVKEEVVKEREFENRRLNAEVVAEVTYRPSACKYTYRMVVVRKNISVAKGEKVLFDEILYFFYITNVLLLEPKQIVLVANNRRHQENLLAQLHGGGAGLDSTREYVGGQLGLHGDDGLDLELKSLVGVVAPGSTGELAATAPRGKAVGVGTGVQDIRAGVCQEADRSLSLMTIPSMRLPLL